MYIRLTRARFESRGYDEVMAIIQDVIAAFRQQPGFMSYYTAIDHSGGMAINVSTWDTEEHARVPRSVLGDAVPRLQATGFQLEAPEFYEVVAQS